MVYMVDARSAEIMQKPGKKSPGKLAKEYDVSYETVSRMIKMG